MISDRLSILKILRKKPGTHRRTTNEVVVHRNMNIYILWVPLTFIA
jgi:hypothetical protein